MKPLFSKKKANRILKESFGYEEFRQGQLEVLKHLAQGKDSLVVMPTGRGKSLCYQVPAICAQGTALVVSPLISLMKDQVDTLRAKDIRARALNSSLTPKEAREVIEELKSNELDILYIAPERFKNPRFLEALADCKFSFFAIDEAHCHLAGTSIMTPFGDVLVEDLKVNDVVVSSSGSKKIVSTSSRSVLSDRIVHLWFGDKCLQVTDDHPVFLHNVGFVPAGFIRSGDLCYAAKELQKLQQGIHVEIQGARQESTDFLFSGLLEERKSPYDREENLPKMLQLLHRKGFLDSDLLLGTVWCIKGSRCCVGSNDPRQSNEAARRASEGVKSFEGSGSYWSGESWWEWSPDVRTTEDGWTVVSFFDLGIQNSDRQNARRETSWCEDRLGGPKKEISNRSRRSVSQSIESSKSRQKEGQGSQAIGLETVTRVERGCDVWESETSFTVFSIGLEEQHNYFADGILVHNCISKWGHDFRVDYRRLGAIREMLNVPTVALTATATSAVQKDIVEQLKMSDCFKIITGFDRPNLEYDIRWFKENKVKEMSFTGYMRQALKTDGSGIIYVGTKDNTTKFARLVNEIKTGSCASYHGGMRPKDRKKFQEDFLSGKKKWVVATNAFGMGIDKADVRHVVHAGLPGSVEAWYQEVGRAGRDDKPAKCVMFFSGVDESLQWFFVRMANPPKHIFTNLWDVLWSFKQQVLSMTYAEIYEMYTSWYGGADNDGSVFTALRVMKKDGAIDPKSPRGQIMFTEAEKTSISKYVDFKKVKAKYDMDANRLRTMIEFAKDTGSIRDRVLKYFGEKP